MPAPDSFDDAPAATYSYLAQELSRRQIAWLQVGTYGQDWDVYGTLRPLFKGPMVGVGGFTCSGAREQLAADAVYGKRPATQLR